MYNRSKLYMVGKSNYQIFHRIKNTWKIVRITALMSWQIIRRSIIQRITNNMIKLDNHTYIIEYILHGRRYKTIISHFYKGPCPILMILDDEENDVTNQILPLMGPNYDFGGHKITPRWFKFTNLALYLSNGDVKTFSSDESIRVT